MKPIDNKSSKPTPSPTREGWLTEEQIRERRGDWLDALDGDFHSRGDSEFMVALCDMALAALRPACGACEIEKRHGIPSADPHTCNPAPACKTCGGSKVVDCDCTSPGWHFAHCNNKPCPDCNPAPSSEVSND